MEKIYNVAHSVRAFLFCNPTDRRIRKLDPGVRSALVNSIEEQSIRDTLNSLEAELETANESLQTSLEKEQFLGVRYHQYRKKLDARARELQNHRDAPDYESQLEQWEKDEDALNSIKNTQKTILTECEKMRRKIRELSKRKHDLQRLNGQCEEFVEASKQQDDPTAIEVPHYDEEAAHHSPDLPAQNEDALDAVEKDIEYDEEKKTTEEDKVETDDDRKD